jgi:hypothetical protein
MSTDGQTYKTTPENGPVTRTTPVILQVTVSGTAKKALLMDTKDLKDSWSRSIPISTISLWNVQGIYGRGNGLQDGLRFENGVFIEDSGKPSPTLNAVP